VGVSLVPIAVQWLRERRASVERQD